MTRPSRFVFLIALIFPQISLGAQVFGLYEAEVPAVDQTAVTRKQALATALRVVLVKITGDRNVASRSALVPLLEDAQHYVQQYRYRTESPATGNGTASNTEGLTLWVRFDAGALDRRLRELGVSIWDQERPSTLVWLVIEDTKGRRLIGTDEPSEYAPVLTERAGVRGIPVLVPLMDLEDSGSIKSTDVWGDFAEPILKASERYHPDAVLAGRIAPVSPGFWEGRWTLYVDGQSVNWVSQGDLPAFVLDEGIDTLADNLATRFARTGVYTETAGVEVVVTDIFNVDEYARVLRYLQSLKAVTDVQVRRVDPGKVTFLVVARGGADAIAQAVSLGDTLELIARGAEPSYRLLR
ncbi:MAG: DUF2066 domain-containing protein [Gammaproteobacteria bacterium]|nr:DUF2066 domain-containing protein [Gammaproteobacteria bacterium]